MRRLNSPLLRNIRNVASGTVAGQVIVFAFSPLITRIYSPEIFGLQGIFLALVSIFSPLIAMRYPMAIVVADNEEDVARLSQLSFLIAFGLSGILGFLILTAQAQVLSLLGAEALGHLIWFLPVALLCVALKDVADYRAARFDAFRLIGIVTVIQAFLSNLARVLGGLITPVAGILIGVTSAAPALQSALLHFGLRNRAIPSPPVSASAMVSLLKKHKDFALYRMPTDTLNAASQSVPVVLLAALFSPAVAGLYTLTRIVFNLPLNVISASIGNVLYARFAEQARNGEPILPLLVRSTAALLAITPMIIGFAWFAPAVFAFVFGEEWREAGNYARWVSLWIGVGIATVPAVRCIPVIDKQKVALIFNVALAALRVFSIVAIYWLSGSAIMAVASFSVVSALMNALMIIIFIWYAARFDRLGEEPQLK